MNKFHTTFLPTPPKNAKLPVAPQNPNLRIRVTMDDVAREAGVSRATVSRVLAGTAAVSGESHDKVHKAILALGYVPNHAAQSLAARKPSTPVVGLMLRDPLNSAYGLLHFELQKHCEELGLQLVTTTPSSRGVVADELSALHRLLSLGVNGIFLATGTINPSDVESLLDAVPMISVGRPELHNEISAVSYDEDTHGVLIADAVIQHGHRRVGVAVTDPSRSVPEHRRSASMVKRLRNAGVTVVEVPIHLYSDHMHSTNILLDMVQEKMITAVLFPTDSRAYTFLQACANTGIRVPEDVSVTGMDGTRQELRYVGLTSLRIPVEAAASRAAALMKERLGNARRPVTHEAFVGFLVDGATLAGPPQAAL